MTKAYGDLESREDVEEFELVGEKREPGRVSKVNSRIKMTAKVPMVA